MSCPWTLVRASQRLEKEKGVQKKKERGERNGNEKLERERGEGRSEERGKEGKLLARQPRIGTDGERRGERKEWTGHKREMGRKKTTEKVGKGGGKGGRGEGTIRWGRGEGGREEQDGAEPGGGRGEGELGEKEES